MCDRPSTGRPVCAARDAQQCRGGSGAAGAARILPRAGSSLSAEIADVLSDHHILQELEPEAETSWKAQGTLTACPPGLWAITWSSARFHPLRALSVGSPGRGRQANSSFPLPGHVDATWAGLHGPGLRRD